MKYVVANVDGPNGTTYFCLAEMGSRGLRIVWSTDIRDAHEFIRVKDAEVVKALAADGKDKPTNYKVWPKAREFEVQ